MQNADAEGNTAKDVKNAKVPNSLVPWGEGKGKGFA